MARSAYLIALVAAIAASPAHALPFFDFHGYSYLNGPPFALGTIITVPTRFNDIQPDPIWPLELSSQEYTVLVQGLTISDVQSYGPIRVMALTGGQIGLYRDSGRNSQWTADPPNAAVPATFLDGTPELSGFFAAMDLVYDTSTGTGTISGSVTWTAGARLSEIGNPVGWTYFGGVSNHDGLGIPSGYDLAWDPQIYGPEGSSPVENTSWGDIKRTFRGDRQ